MPDFRTVRTAIERSAIGLCLAALAGGCISSADLRSRVSQSEPPLAIDPEGAIAVTEATSLWGNNAFVGCVTKSLASENPALRTVPIEKFRAAVFEDTVLPSKTDDLVDYMIGLADEPIYRDRIAASNVRYMVFVSEPSTTESRSKEYCDAGVGAGVAIASCREKTYRRTEVDATVLDLKEGREAGSVSARVSGTGTFDMLVLGLPFFFVEYAATESQACRDLGKALANALSAESAAEGDQ